MTIATPTVNVIIVENTVAKIPMTSPAVESPFTLFFLDTALRTIPSTETTSPKNGNHQNTNPKIPKTKPAIAIIPLSSSFKKFYCYIPHYIVLLSICQFFQQYICYYLSK